MKTYEQAKKELDSDISNLMLQIKNLKRTKTNDNECPQCKKITKKRVWIATLGKRKKTKGQGIVYCDANCRAKAYRQRKEQSIRDGYESEIHLLKQRITELENG